MGVEGSGESQFHPTGKTGGREADQGAHEKEVGIEERIREKQQGVDFVILRIFVMGQLLAQETTDNYWPRVKSLAWLSDAPDSCFTSRSQILVP